jgi:glucose/arabinose dehydrogenase
MHTRWSRHVAYVTCIVIAIGTVARAPVAAATLPSGFTEAQIASGLASPTAMQFAPDGRLFVCEQGGRLRVIKNGVLLPTPFVTLTVTPPESAACSGSPSIRASR